MYLFVASPHYPTSETAIINMIKETGGNRYEDARSINQQLTFEKTENYFSKHGLPFGDWQKRTLNIIGADDTYTNPGMLLSDQCVHTIKLAVFEGNKKSVFRDRKELSGSLLTQLEDAFSYIDQFNHARAEVEGLDRQEILLHLAEKRGYIIRKDVESELNVSQATTILILRDMVEKRLLIREGFGKRQKYRTAE